MPNYAYLKGVRKERKLVNTNKALGHISFRSAGSHSPIDVVVINERLKAIRFYQAKSDKMPQSQITKLEQKYKFLNDFFKASFKVV